MQRLITTGDLAASRTAGNAWLVDALALNALVRARPERGRPWSSGIAWAALWPLSDLEADWLDRRGASRLSERLASLVAEGLVHATRRRAVVHHFRVSNSFIEELTAALVRSGASAMTPATFGVASGTAHVDGYCDDGALAGLVRDFHLVGDARGNATQRNGSCRAAASPPDRRSGRDARRCGCGRRCRVARGQGALRWPARPREPAPVTPIHVTAPPRGWAPPWPLVVEVAATLPEKSWVLVGGLMVQLHARAAGVIEVRPTRDVDALVDAMAVGVSVAALVRLWTGRGFEVVEPGWPDFPIHRLCRSDDVINILMADHLPERSQPRLDRHPVMSVDGGAQALVRTQRIVTTMSSRPHGPRPAPPDRRSDAGHRNGRRRPRRRHHAASGPSRRQRSDPAATPPARLLRGATTPSPTPN